MSQPRLRARIRRGLLKLDQMHVLARDVYYARRGRINARELHEQMNSYSCLMLIVASIIYRQAKEISRIINACNPASHDIDTSFLPHISSIGWDNVILYGQYRQDPDLIEGYRRTCPQQTIIRSRRCVIATDSPAHRSEHSS